MEAVQIGDGSFTRAVPLTHGDGVQGSRVESSGSEERGERSGVEWRVRAGRVGWQRSRDELARVRRLGLVGEGECKKEEGETKSGAKRRTRSSCQTEPLPLLVGIFRKTPTTINLHQ